MVSLVRHGAEEAHREVVLPRPLQAVQTWSQARLAILPLVLRRRHPEALLPRIQRRALCGTVPQLQLRPQESHALHALLPLVPDQGGAQMEAPREWQAVREMRLGSSHRLLVGVSLVWNSDERKAVRDLAGCRLSALGCHRYLVCR